MTKTHLALPTLKPGTLWQRVQEQTQHALQCGALQPIPTEHEFIEDHGIQFLVRVLSNLNRKDQAKQKEAQITAKSGKDFNPFLPYEPDLFVADISETHLCLLNKFNVVDHHLLIITRAFEEQESLLTLEDFLAVWACLAEVNGFVFYNAGKAAGASQRHKHLQLIPLPLLPEYPQLPIESALATAIFENGIGQIPCFPFQHALIQFDFNNNQNTLEKATNTLNCYQKILDQINIIQALNPEQHPNIRAYNLLMTKEWLFIIPRLQESFHNIPVNAAGFAGTLFARNAEQMQILKTEGPIKILQGVGFPKPDHESSNKSA